MTDDEKNRIAKLRQVGMGYKKIASILGINESTVKSNCRRHNLEGRVESPRRLCFQELYTRHVRTAVSCSYSTPVVGKRSSAVTPAA